MKKIFTSALVLCLLLLGMVENYCFGHSSLHPEFFLIEEKSSSINHLVKLVNEEGKDIFEAEFKYLIQEKPEFHEGVVDDTDEIHLNIASENSPNHNNTEDVINEPSFLPGEKVTLIAEPYPGFNFINWTIDGNEVSKNLTYIFIMPSKNVSIQANFRKESVIAPTISITGPSPNAQFMQGDNISITTNAADSDGTIAKVEFYSGSTLLGTDTTFPYSFAWGNIPTGSFTLTAKATDNQGAATVSAGVTINVVEKGNVAPTVSITGPATNTQFILGDNISITANAADSDGTIAKVEFFNGTTLLGTDNTIPYNFTWSNLPVGNFVLTAKATDNKGTATASALVNINVVEKTSRSPFGGKAATIPGTIEAENYDMGGQGVVYNDVDAGNNGGKYRADDVDIQAASEGAYNVGWMKVREWLEYTVNVETAGTYTLDARVASPAVGGTFHIECNGLDVTGPLTVPATSGWNIWTSVTKTGVNLPAGTHVLRFVIDSNGPNGYLGNLNSLKFSNSNVAPTVNITAPGANAQFNLGDNLTITANAADSDGTITKVEFYNGNTLLGTDTTSPYNFAWSNLPAGSFTLTAKATNNKGTSTVSAVVNINVKDKTSRSPFGGTVATIPGTVEAENYDIGGEGVTYHDVDAGNNGSVYRTEDVDIEAASEGGYNLGWMRVGEWLEYSVNILTAGSYSLDARVSSPAEGGIFHIECNGVDVTGPLKVPATGSWDTWTSVTKTGVNLPAGTHILRFVLDTKGVNGYWGYWGNLNSLTFTKPNDTEAYRITMNSTTEIPGKTITTSNLTEAQAGEKLIFFAEEEEGIVFDQWSIDGVPIGKQTLVELEMPANDITLTKHFRTFVAPEITIVLPDQKSEFEAMSEVNIKLETKSNDGIIEKVELFNGEKLVGELIQDSTALNWKHIPEGIHKLVARITDANGKTYFSDPVLLKAIDSKRKDNRDILLEYVIGPNPTTEQLNVIFTNLDGIYDFEFRVVSMNGVVQKSFNLSPKESLVTIDVSDLKEGVYVLHLIANGNNISSKKFIKK